MKKTQARRTGSYITGKGKRYTNNGGYLGTIHIYAAKPVSQEVGVQPISIARVVGVLGGGDNGCHDDVGIEMFDDCSRRLATILIPHALAEELGKDLITTAGVMRTIKGDPVAVEGVCLEDRLIQP